MEELFRVLTSSLSSGKIVASQVLAPVLSVLQKQEAFASTLPFLLLFLFLFNFSFSFSYSFSL